MEKLNSDMVLEIVTRLPIKSVLQCRKVCRIWRRIFGKPKTGMIFKNRSSNYDHTELCYGELPSEMVNSNLTNEPQNSYKIVTRILGDIGEAPPYYFVLAGSCNDLVCYLCYRPIFNHDVYIYNPIMGERVRVPKLDEYYQCAGFGYCHLTGTYKLVQIPCSTTSGEPRRVQVYTLGDGSGWRDIPEITCRFTGFWGVYANGFLHWLTERSSCDIVAFDLTCETFQYLPSPKLSHFSSDSYIRVTLEGDLCLCLSYIEQDEPMMDVWTLKKKNVNNLKARTYVNSFTWIRVFSRKVDSSSKCQLLSLTETEILFCQNDILSCYDLKAQPTSTILWCHEGAKGYDGAIPHMNSLVSLKDLGEELVDMCETRFAH